MRHTEDLFKKFWCTIVFFIPLHILKFQAETNGKNRSEDLTLKMSISQMRQTGHPSLLMDQALNSLYICHYHYLAPQLRKLPSSFRNQASRTQLNITCPKMTRQKEGQSFYCKSIY